MSIIRSIYGDDVEVGTGQCPEAYELLPTDAMLLGRVSREGNTGMDLEDNYYLSFSESKNFRLLWVSVKDLGPEVGMPRMNRLLAWCPATGIEPKSAAAAMLEFIWANQDDSTCGVIYEHSEITAPGLLSVAALQEVKDVALEIYIKDEVPFEEPKPRPKPAPGQRLSLKEMGIRLREAGPNNPIYRRGWIVGGTRLKR